MMTQSPPDSETFRVDMEPVGRRIEIASGTSLLGAAQAAGVGVVSLCGGEGWCESCLIRLEKGELSSPTAAEIDILTEKDIAAGYRLACQAVPLSDAKIDIPPESLTAPQRLQVEGKEIAVELDPPVKAVDLSLAPPTLHDLRADLTRLADALTDVGYVSVSCQFPVLADLSDRLRAYGWSTRLALYQSEVSAVLPGESQLLGLAVDIGTTKLATYLLDLATGETVIQTGALNPQIAYGEDVVSRIAYTDQHQDGRHIMQRKLIETLNTMIAQMCAEISVSSEQIGGAVVVGNTAMQHLFAGLPVRQLAQAPYVPAIGDALDLRAYDIGLNLAPGAYVHLPPNIAGYVGADHVAMILATGIGQTGRTAIAVDIGTNTEITLAVGGRLMCCSCASGPVFEGAHIRDGMRAASGAIERVQIVGEEIRTSTIDDQPPVGICGSGILDAVAEMRAAGILDSKGTLSKCHPLVHIDNEKRLEFVLVPSGETGHGRDIAVTRKDVSEIQLAKGAIRAGFEILMAKAGVEPGAVEEFIVAGAFGTYIDIPNAVRVGMFPDLPKARPRQVGNAAGMGAKLMVLSSAQRRAAVEIVERVEYVELTIHAEFQTAFLNSMFL